MGLGDRAGLCSTGYPQGYIYVYHSYKHTLILHVHSLADIFRDDCPGGSDWDGSVSSRVKLVARPHYCLKKKSAIAYPEIPMRKE